MVESLGVVEAVVVVVDFDFDFDVVGLELHAANNAAIARTNTTAFTDFVFLNLYIKELV